MFCLCAGHFPSLFPSPPNVGHKVTKTAAKIETDAGKAKMLTQIYLQFALLPISHIFSDAIFCLVTGVNGILNFIL